MSTLSARNIHDWLVLIGDAGLLTHAERVELRTRIAALYAQTPPLAADRVARTAPSLNALAAAFYARMQQGALVRQALAWADAEWIEAASVLESEDA